MSNNTGNSSDRAKDRPNGKVVAAKVPGTPRRERSRDQSRSRGGGVQTPELKDYVLGDCIGRGGFGSVYRALHWGTGESVAIKQIKLSNVPKNELRTIEAEIDLLRNLHHDNIVKYIGFVKTVDYLNIILEYCENGSLYSICKTYGKFPENLVGVYMTQVLQGLQYLHDQGVIHRDIKGANILTTKDGTIKLADFGVSITGPDKEGEVVGTPYWMAPEIILLSGATSASDIWSVGATVIELLQGKPMYHNLATMPALFAIVNDDHPPLPEGVSPAARDFLIQCFQKDPNLRVSAKKLLKHPWITSCRRSDAPVSKASDNFSQAVEEVKQWNMALKSSEQNLRASTGSDGGGPPLQGNPGGRFGNLSDPHRIATPAKGPLVLKSRPIAEAFRSPELADDDNWDNDFASVISPTALNLPHVKGQDNFGGLFSADRLKAFASIDASRDELSTGDDTFEGELRTIKDLRQWSEPDPQEQTIRPFPKKSSPTKSAESKPQQGHRRQKSSKSGGSSSAILPPQSKSPAKSQSPKKFDLPARRDTQYREGSEDFSDFFNDNESVFNQRLNPVAKDTPQLFHPSDLTSLPRSMQSPVGGSMRRKVPSSRPSVLPDRAFKRARSAIEIQRYAEDEDEDFSDIFGPGDGSLPGDKEESDRGSEDGQQLMLLSKLSNNSWLGDDEDEDDPFAVMDPGWDEMDLEANIARDRHARLAEEVEDLVRSLKTTEGEEILSKLAEDLLGLLWQSPETQSTDIKHMIISAHGLLPILEILEPCGVKSRQRMILHLLKIVNAIILDDVELQENLCFVGGIPIITKFAARQFSNEIRLEAAAFVRQMYQTSTTTLQMFVSAGGLNVLVEFLDEDYDTSRDLVLIGVNGIWNVFELQGPTPKNDFCRIFSRSKILDPLAIILNRVLDEERDELSELIEGRIVNIFYLFSQAENYVKEVVADRQVLKTVLKDLSRMTPVHRITMLKFIKNLSMLSTTLESLHSADAIDFLIAVLSQSMEKGQKHFREISNHVLNTMFNLCRLSKERQEYAAGNGIIPLLMKVLKTDHPPKEFVLPILCDMAHSGSKGRRNLWINKGLDFYVSLIPDQYWQVTALDAILVWLQEETAKVEAQLKGGKFTSAIISCFNQAKSNAFDANLLEPLLRLLRLSPILAASLAKAQMYAGITQKLGHKKAVVRLNLLRLVRSIMDGCEADGSNMASASSASSAKQLRILFDDIQMLADQDPAVLVRNLAAELVRSQVDMGLHSDALGIGSLSLSGSGGPASGLSSNAGSAGGPRSRSGPRRTTSYTPPGLHSSISMPPTPTQSQRQSAAYIEVAQTPKRPNNPVLYRPRSRDGVNITSIPRRVSGETTTSSINSSVVKSRLPRTSTHLSRGSIIPPPSPLLGGRSESSSSNKENSYSHRQGSGSSSSGPGSGSYGASVPSATTGSASLSGSSQRPPSSRSEGPVVAGSVKRRNSRVPSSDLRMT